MMTDRQRVFAAALAFVIAANVPGVVAGGEGAGEVTVKAARVEDLLSTTMEAAFKSRDEALVALGATWLDGRGPKAAEWVSGKDGKKTFGDRWHQVLSHTRPEDVEAGIVRAQDFEAVALENLYAGLGADGELDADRMGLVEAQIERCAEAGVRAVPNFFNTALDGQWGPELPEWFGELNYTASHAAILGKPSFAEEYIWVFAESDPRFQKKLYGRELGADVIRRGGRRNLWEQLAWGKCGVVAFSLRFSSPWGNDLLVNEQRLHPKAGALLRMRTTAERVREITRDTEIAFAPAAILETVDATYLSRPSEIPLSDARALNHFCVQRHMPTFYLPERAVLAGEASLDDFRVILAPWCYLLSREMSEKLAAWVKAGGYLIASGPIGLMDGYKREGTALSKLLPESVKLTHPGSTIAAAALVLEGGGRIEMNPWRHVLWRRDGTALPDATRAVLSPDQWERAAGRRGLCDRLEYDAKQTLRNRSPRKTIHRPRPISTYMGEVDAFARAILEDKETDFPAEQAIWNLRLCEAVYRSARTGRVIRL